MSYKIFYVPVMAFTWKKYSPVSGNRVSFVSEKVRFQLSKAWILRWWKWTVLCHLDATLRKMCVWLHKCTYVSLYMWVYVWMCYVSMCLCVWSDHQIATNDGLWWACSAEQICGKIFLSQICTLRKCQTMNVSHKGQNLLPSSTDLLKSSTGFQQKTNTASGQGTHIFMWHQYCGNHIAKGTALQED